MSPIDPRSPLVFNTRELGRRPGAMHAETRRVELPEAVGTDVIAVAAGTPVEIDVRYESVLEGVLATGTVTTTATGACVRCLDEVSLPVEPPFQELFAYADRARHHEQVASDEAEDDDVRELEGDLLDLEPVLVDAVVPALPFQPVCRADCPGLCSECGARLADDPDHHHDVIDPRWSALQGLTINQEKRN